MDAVPGSGSIELILGPMFSGKTTELLRRMRRHRLADRRVVVIKYVKDTRYHASRCTTHDYDSWDALCAARLDECRSAVAEYDVIGIDEGQFFPDVPSFVEDMANAGKMVIVAALDGTYQKRPFGRVLELVPLAESVIKLSAVCMMCKRDAAFSQRISSEREVEVIGGPEKYVALCRACHLRYTPSHIITDFYPAVTNAPNAAAAAAPGAARPSSAPSTPMRASATHAASASSSCRRI